MTNTSNLLVTVRSDGVHHHSEFSGWDSENAVFKTLKERKDDKKTIYAAVFVGDESSRAKGDWSLRTVYIADTARKD